VPHVAFNGRRTRVRQDTLHCGWTIRKSAIKVLRYRMQAAGHDIRGRGRTSPLTNTTNPLFHPRKPLHRGALLCPGNPASGAAVTGPLAMGALHPDRRSGRPRQTARGTDADTAVEVRRRHTRPPQIRERPGHGPASGFGRRPAGEPIPLPRHTLQRREHDDR
jgi:hypothetical protein